MVKKFVVLFIVMIIIIGCGNRSKEFLNRSEEIVEDEVITLTMFSEDLNASYEDFESPVALEITKHTGVRLEIEYPISDIAEKTGIMMASGDYPDLIMIKDTASFVDAKAYIDLTDLIEEHAPNLKKLYGDVWKRLSYSDTDDSIYVLPMASVNNAKMEPVMGFQLQHDVVKTLGYPEIKTLQDYENALLQYIEMYPEINGEKTIGITLITDDWRWLISLGNGAAFATGKPDDGQWYINPDTYEATYRFLLDDEKEYFRWLNHMYDIGLIDPESFVQKFEAYETKIVSGRVLGLIDAYWQYRTAEQTLITKGEYLRSYGQYPVQYDESTKAAEFRSDGYLGGYGIGISVNCEDPIKAIKFLDFMASDEGQILRNWGIEGVHHYVDENGKRYIPEDILMKRLQKVDYARETGVGAYLYPFPSWGMGVKDPTGNTYSIDSTNYIIKGYNEVEKEVLDAYGVDIWKELYPDESKIRPSDWGAAWTIPTPEETGISVILEKCDAIVKAGIIDAIISSPEAFDNIWGKMIKDLEMAGVYDMNEAFTELVKQKVEEWNE